MLKKRKHSHHRIGFSVSVQMVDVRDFSWADRYLFCIVKVTFLSCVRQHNDLLDSQGQKNYEQPNKREQSSHPPLASTKEALLNGLFLSPPMQQRGPRPTASVHPVARKPLKNDPRNKASLMPLGCSTLKTSYPSNSYPSTLCQVD